MIRTAEVVIGANFGDEGKGLITDFLAAPAGPEALVVRFNGGAQAGHTVVTPEGQRHIFSHFGCGSFTGAQSFLSRFFVCHPLLFRKEYDLLRSLGVAVAVHVDARSMVTTPYDMMINQIAEEARGNGRHGSCGMGFGETIERHVSSPYGLTYADFLNGAELKQKLREIQKGYLPARLEKLDITTLPEKWRERISGGGVLEKYLEDIAFFLQATRRAPDSYLALTDKKIIFEGAQGLLLDQTRGWFPHVTRSHTGIKNVLTLAEEAGLEGLNVTYITRAYATRHGAGPLPHELPDSPVGAEDKTNIRNDWQGHLRFAWLDADLLAASLKNDLSDKRSAIQLRHGLAVTCLDQLEADVSFVKENKILRETKDTFLDRLRTLTGAAFMLASMGPSRADVNRVL